MMLGFAAGMLESFSFKSSATVSASQAEARQQLEIRRFHSITLMSSAGSPHVKSGLVLPFREKGLGCRAMQNCFGLRLGASGGHDEGLYS